MEVPAFIVSATTLQAAAPDPVIVTVLAPRLIVFVVNEFENVVQVRLNPFVVNVLFPPCPPAEAIAAEELRASPSASVAPMQAMVIG